MADYVDGARAQATHEMAAALLTAAAEVMARHGNDPTGPVIVAAGFAMALRAIGEHNRPEIPRIVREMLESVP